MKTCISLFCLALAGGVLAYQPQAVARISGAVLAEQGQPIAGAVVWADLLGNSPKALPIPHAETDKDGRFVINHLEWGAYKLRAMKEEDGYPNTHWSFYSNGSSPTVRLTRESPAQQVTIALGPKAGALTGAISDLVTGKPLSGSVRMWRIKSPDNFFGTSVNSHYRVLLPPNVEVGVEVSAPGYQDWYYPGYADASQSAPLSVGSGETVHLDIGLRPKP